MAFAVTQQVAKIGARAVAIALFIGAALAQAELSQPDSVAPAARQLLKTATDFLAAQPRFSLDTDSSLDVVLPSGQKIQFDHTVRVAVERPNRWRAERTGELVDQVAYYDGKSLTLYNPDGRYYASIAAPATLEEALDFAREKLDLVAPAGDLLYRNAYDILMKDVTAGIVVGKGRVDGVRCDHLAFRAPNIDWQIWIEDGGRPLVRKLVITSLDMLNAPQFTVITKNWNLSPQFDAGTFRFAPPEGTQKREFVLKDAAKTQ